jgi:hypothetical protein
MCTVYSKMFDSVFGEREPCIPNVPYLHTLPVQLAIRRKVKVIKYSLRLFMSCLTLLQSK